MLQRTSAAFLAAVEAFRTKVPDEFFQEELEGLRQALLNLLLRICSQLSSSDSVALRCCCTFPDFFDSISCKVRFFSKYMDSDLYTLMERTVPPIQLDAIGKFRSVLFKYNRKVGVRVNEHVFLAWPSSPGFIIFH